MRLPVIKATAERLQLQKPHNELNKNSKNNTALDKLLCTSISFVLYHSSTGMAAVAVTASNVQIRSMAYLYLSLCSIMFMNTATIPHFTE